MLQRFKVTKSLTNTGEFYIDKTKDILVHTTSVTVSAYAVNNVPKAITLERPDGTVLGRQIVMHCQSQASSVLFPDRYVLPMTDPIVKVNISGMGTLNVTLDCTYEEVEFER